MHDEDDESRYMSDLELQAREDAKKPWWKRAGNMVLDGCSIGAIAALGIAGAPLVWAAREFMA